MSVIPAIHSRDEKPAVLRDYHEKVVEPARLENDYIYSMLYAPSTEWRLSQFTYMANELLNRLHIAAGDETSPIALCVKLLFGIDGMKKPDNSNKPGNQKSMNESKMTREEEYIHHTWQNTALALIMFVNGDCETNNSPQSMEYGRRVKIAQDAFLFLNLHLSAWVTLWLYNADSSKNPSDPSVLNKHWFLHFCRRTVRDQLQFLVNGVTTSMENFVSMCIGEYISTVGVYNPSDKNKFEYDPVPKINKSKEF
jgi:hypothetical protein